MSAPPGNSIRALMTPDVRRLFVGMGFNSLGGGLTLPLLVIYLNQVRGISVANATLVLSWMAIVGLAATPVYGWLVDHVGPRKVLIVAVSTEAVGTALWATVHSTVGAYVVATVVALGANGTWSPQATLISRMTSEENRQRLFGLQFMLLNLGLGLGGLISSFMVNIDSVESFIRLYLLNAVSFVIYLVVVISLREHGGPIPDEDRPQDSGGYRDVFKDTKLIRYSFLATLLLTVGYGSLDAGLPTFMTTVGPLSVQHVGIIWGANTGVIVIAQWFVIKRIEGRSRTKLIGVVGVLWALSWLMISLATRQSILLSVILASVGVGIFAIGEMLWSPIGPAILNDLAPEHLRGRYNAVAGITWTIAGTLGPASTGLFLGKGWPNQWIAVLVLGCLFAALFAQTLRKRLTPAQDGITV